MKCCAELRYLTLSLLAAFGCFAAVSSAFSHLPVRRAAPAGQEGGGASPEGRACFGCANQRQRSRQAPLNHCVQSRRGAGEEVKGSASTAGEPKRTRKAPLEAGFRQKEGAPRKPCVAYDALGTKASYGEVWELQKQLLSYRVSAEGATASDLLLLVQHPPVYTLGTGSSTDHLLFNKDDPDAPELHRVERGGEVTYHGPGQLVVYPIIDLTGYEPDLHWYIRSLEEVIIRALSRLGIEAGRREGLTGVWVGRQKLAAIGIKVRRWVTMHGLALNVHPNLQHFQHIVPCGIEQGDLSVGSVEQHRPGTSMEEVREALLEAFAEVFDMELTHQSGLPVSPQLRPAQQG